MPMRARWRVSGGGADAASGLGFSEQPMINPLPTPAVDIERKSRRVMGEGVMVVVDTLRGRGLRTRTDLLLTCHGTPYTSTSM
jgi:hypothetical protein